MHLRAGQHQEPEAVSILGHSGAVALLIWTTLVLGIRPCFAKNSAVLGRAPPLVSVLHTTVTLSVATATESGCASVVQVLSMTKAVCGCGAMGAIGSWAMAPGTTSVSRCRWAGRGTQTTAQKVYQHQTRGWCHHDSPCLALVAHCKSVSLQAITGFSNVQGLLSPSFDFLPICSTSEVEQIWRKSKLGERSSDHRS